MSDTVAAEKSTHGGSFGCELRDGRKAGEQRERESVSDEKDGNAGFWQRLQRARPFVGWMTIAGRFGHVQTLLLLVLFYGLLIGPVGLALTLARRDFLDRRGLRQDGSAWREADSAEPDLERAKLLS